MNPEIDKLVTHLLSIRDKYYLLLEKTTNKKIIDLIGKIINCNNSTVLSLVRFDKLHQKQTWLEMEFKNVDIIKNNSDRWIYLKEYGSSLKIGYFIAFINNCLESSFKELTKNNKNKLIDSGKQILKQINKNNLIDESIFELLSTIRNTIHTNWVHSPDNPKKDKHIIKYKNKNYIFTKWDSIGIITWDLIIEINEDIYNFIEQYILQDNIKTIF